MTDIKNKVTGIWKKYKLIILAVLGVAFLIIPLFVNKSYIMGIFCRVFMYATLAGSLNVINGYTNQFSLGHAGFFCVGAYLTAILTTNLNISFWIVLPLSGILAALIGLLVVLPTLKLQGMYLSIVTMGFSEIIRLIALNWNSVTGGPDGIKGIPSPTLFGLRISKASQYYYLFFIVLVLFLFFTSRVLKSKIGRAWISIREDQLAARSLGIEINKYKAMNFMYGAFWAGIIGAVYAPYFKYISSDMFTLDEGFNIMSMAIIGGLGTLVGPLLGSGIVSLLTEFLRPVSQYRMVVYAILIIVVMWLRPQGIAGDSASILAGANVKLFKKFKKKANNAERKEV